MSWAEVKKLNSDFVNEPLNFSHYVSDISNTQEDSYVLDTSNNHLWRLLLKDSLAMFGHDAIHETVYNRLYNPITVYDDVTNDCDYTLTKNGRLGQCFNGFYNTNVFSPGNIDKVLKTMTNEKFNILEVKWQQSICRYLTLHTSGTSGVGAWLSEIYGVAVSGGTLAEILNTPEYWEPTGVFMTCEPLRVGVCSSSVGIALAGASSTSTWFNNYVETVAQRTITTTELWDLLQANNKLDAFWGTYGDPTTQVAATHVLKSAASMTALIYHPYAFKSMCGNLSAIEVLCRTTDQYDVLFGGWYTSGLSEQKLIDIRSTMATLNTQVSDMPPESHNIREIEAAQTSIQTAIDTLTLMNSKADVLASNFATLNTSTVAWTGIAVSDSAMYAITRSLPASLCMARSAVAMEKVAASLVAMDRIVQTSIAISACMQGPPAYPAIVQNATSKAKFVAIDSETLLQQDEDAINRLKSDATQSVTIGASAGGYVRYSTTFYGNFSYTGDTFTFSCSNSYLAIRLATNEWDSYGATASINRFYNSARTWIYLYWTSGYIYSSAEVFKLYA